MTLKKRFNTIILLLIFIPSIIIIIITNLFMKQLAYQEAYSKMEIMMVRTNAIHEYLNQEARPVLFELMEDYGVSHYFFRPEIMSSTYAVREINDIFLNNINQNYYFKEISANPRNPKNEANEFEAEILEQFNMDRSYTEFQTVEILEGEPVFRYIRRGEILEEACMPCHSEPEKAPSGLLDIYGDQRGFYKEIDTVVSAQSVMIPLKDAYAIANRLSMIFGVILLAFMSGTAVFLSKFTEKNIFLRLTNIEKHFKDILQGRTEIGDPIEDFRADEIGTLMELFNIMSIRVRDFEKALKDERDKLREKVEEQTSFLLDKNKELEKEVIERKQAEEKLDSYVLELERINKELQDFTSIASHDLQEPLRKIRAFGSRLKEDYAALLDEKGKDYFERMYNSAERMQSLIEDLLALSRVTSNRQPFTEVNLNHVLQEVINDLEVQIKKSGGRVEAEDLPTLEANETQMRQLFQNLISNSLKYCREKDLPVVNITSRYIEDGNFEITFTDNGIGFDEVYKERIFKPFQRLHGRSEYSGTGMGLAICQKIVQHHGGNITVKSTPRKGSSFIVRLPRKGDKERINYD